MERKPGLSVCDDKYDHIAENEVADIDENLIIKQIKDFINYLRTSEAQHLEQVNGEAFYAHVAQRYEYLFRKQKYLFEIVLFSRDKFRFDLLAKLLSTRRELASGNASRQACHEKISKLGHDTYIKPVLESPGFKEYLESEEGKQYAKNYAKTKKGTGGVSYMDIYKQERARRKKEGSERPNDQRKKEGSERPNDQREKDRSERPTEGKKRNK